MFRYISALLLLTAALPVFAIPTDGWDVKVEMESRRWRTPSVQWAASIHPSEPAPVEVSKTMLPPPREMWCVDPDRWDRYCAAWEHSMEQWLHHFLDIDYDDPLPTNLPPFPKECTSSCDLF